MIRKQKVQRNLFIANDVALLLGLVLIHYQFTTMASGSIFLLFFVSILFSPFFLIFMAAPLIMEIASHSLYGLAHRPPFPYSLLVTSKIFLCIALVAYWVAVTLAGVREVAEMNVLMTLGIWIYPVLSIIVLTFPYNNHKHSGDTYKKQVETQNL